MQLIVEFYFPVEKELIIVIEERVSYAKGN